MKHMKHLLFVLLFGIILICATACDENAGNANKESKKYPHKNCRDESLVMHSVHSYDSNVDHAVYHGYNANGEFMFSIRDDYAADVQYVDMMDFYYGELKREYSIVNIRGGDYVIFENRFPLNSKHEFDHASYIVSNDENSTTISLDHREKTSYSEDGLTYESGNIKGFLNEDGKILRIIDGGDVNGTGYSEQSYSYDEYGNILTITDKDADGEQTSYYAYEYNEHGQPLRCEHGDSLDVYDYVCFEDLVDTEKEYLDYMEPYAGYWICEKDGETRFLGIAINMLCMGFIDKETGCAVVDQYAFYDVDEDRILDCEFYRNGLSVVKGDAGNREITLSLNGKKLIFEETEYTRLW